MFPVFVDDINVVIEGLGDLFSGTVDLQYVIFLELTPVGWVLVTILSSVSTAMAISPAAVVDRDPDPRVGL